MTRLRARSGGFTIVELLIVIVVIGILAAIAILAYTGVQDRAKAATIQSDLENAAKTMENYKFSMSTSEQYPADLATANLQASTGTTYQYSVNNNLSPASYCLTAANGTTSYYISSLKRTPGAGTCVMNLMPKPISETVTGYNASASGGQASTNTSQPSGGPTGGAYLRRSYTANSGSLATADIFTMGTPGWGGQSGGGVVPAVSGDVFTMSAYVRSSKAQYVKIQAQWLIGASSAGTTNSPDYPLTPNTWTRVSVTATAPATALALRVDVDGTTSSVSWGINDTFDITNVMVTAGPTLYNYADGSSTNWVWNGTANNAISIGPAL